jgi:tripartite-type tricarboxylate transporter receptor subunit TctC
MIKTKFVITMLLMMFAATVGAEEPYPSRPVRVVVPFASGGGIDMVARMISQRLQEKLGQAFIVENRPGAGGVVGAEVVAKAKPDGYTILAVPISYAALSSQGKLTFDPLTAFAPIIHIASAPNVILVPPSLHVNTLGEFIRLARENPGKIPYASSGQGSSTHLAAELFKMMAKVDLLHVPFTGGGPALSALLGSHVSMYIGSLPASIPQVKAKSLKALAVTSTQRAPELPDVPTVIESGVPGYEYVGWYGLLAPAGTPAAIIRRLNAEVNGILKEPAVGQVLAGDGAHPVGGTPEQFGEYVKSETLKWSNVMQHAQMEVK